MTLPPEGSSSAREPASNAATLFMALLVLAALVLIGYFAFASRPAGDSANGAAITVEEPGRAAGASAGSGPR